jgi:hypothetical protein
MKKDITDLVRESLNGETLKGVDLYEMDEKTCLKNLRRLLPKLRSRVKEAEEVLADLKPNPYDNRDTIVEWTDILEELYELLNRMEVKLGTHKVCKFCKAGGGGKDRRGRELRYGMKAMCYPYYTGSDVINDYCHNCKAHRSGPLNGKVEWWDSKSWDKATEEAWA